MKKLMYYVLVLSVLAAFILAGCSSSDDDDGGGSNSLPASSGANELSGKTSFCEREKKIEFSVSAAGVGTYTLWAIQEGTDGAKKISGAEYVWIAMATGSYTWNEADEKVYLKPDRVREENEDNDGVYSNLCTRNELITYWKDVFPGLEEREYSSEADKVFGVKTFDYVKATDGTVLAAEQPMKKGTDELNGKNFDVKIWGNTIVGSMTFSASGFTYTPSGGTGYSGLYGYDSTNTSTWHNDSNPSDMFTGKRVYYNIRDYQGQNMKDHYESSSVSSKSSYKSVSEAAAADTMSIFDGQDALYDTDTIHWR
jgi:hypothetical protein